MNKIILILALFTGILYAAAPVMIPMTDKATYDYLDYLDISGVIDIPFTGARPYRSDEIHKLLLSIKDPDSRTKNFIERYEEEYVSTDNKFGKAGSENTVGWFDVYWDQSYVSQNALEKPSYLCLSFYDYLSLPAQRSGYRYPDISQHISDGGIKAYFGYKEFLSLRTNSGVMLKHDYTEHLRDEFQTIVLVPSGGEADFSSEDHTETVLTFAGDDIHISLGKYPVSMGAGTMNSLTLSQMDAYYENMMFSIASDRFKFTTLTGFLLADYQTRYETENPYYAITNDDSSRVRIDYTKREKYLSAHRLEWRALDNLSFGVNEMVISGDRTIEMGYALPILPLFWMGHYYGDHDNSLISFDMLYQPFKNYSVYGELLFDDETFTESWTKNYMNKWAVSAGLYNSKFLTVDGLSFNFEYARVEPYVYGHKYHINRYMNLDYYLSMPAGGDSETLNFSLKYFLDFDKHITLGYTRENRGEPRWGEWDQPLNYKIENKVFLRGTVEKTNKYYAQLTYRYNKYISADLYYSHYDIINYNHNLPRYDKTWLEKYPEGYDIDIDGDGNIREDEDLDGDAVSSEDEHFNYANYQDYYEREVVPQKKQQVYSNNTFALKLNFVIKNYFSGFFRKEGE
ncbi:MAG: hypothetical protein AB7V07_00110 [Candidatus Delongbacteria bacterium]